MTGRRFGDRWPTDARRRTAIVARQVAGRRRGGAHPNQRKTECPYGHAYDRENTYVNRRGHRVCRACNAARWRRAHPRRSRGWGACVGCQREMRTIGGGVVAHGLRFSPRRCPGSRLLPRKAA